MNLKHDELLIGLLKNKLHAEWVEETYGKCFFFSDSVGEREAKFFLWVLKRYGAIDSALADAEQYALIEMLKVKK